MPVSDSADAPNPSFVVVEILDRAAILSVEYTIADQIGIPPQSLFTLVEAPGAAGPGKIQAILSRAAYKALLLKHGGDPGAVTAALRDMGGVASATLTRADAVRTLLVEGAAVPHPAAADAADGQWYLDTINVAGAWRLLGPSRDALAWKDVRVGHIDTGITEHPVFGSGPDRWVRWDEGINYKETGRLPIDPLGSAQHPNGYPGFPGHGTRTASVLAGWSPDQPFYGVAPKVTVVPYRITDTVVIDFFGNATQITRALRHAISDAGCHVLSISLGDPCDPAEGAGAAIDDAYELGVIVVAAAGNVTSEITYPGRFSRVITAGGCTAGLEPWNNGSRGVKVDVSAPADQIFRATAEMKNREVHYFYGGDGDGTSFATAMVAGAAALWRAYHHDRLPLTYPKGWQIVEAFRHCLRKSAARPPGWPTSLYGAGILNVEELLRYPLPPADSLTYQTRLAAREKV